VRQDIVIPAQIGFAENHLICAQGALGIQRDPL
jgi:hypothetical protein